MIRDLLANLDTLLVWAFAGCAFVSASLMLVLRQPMRVALALVSCMIFLGGVYGLLGVHFIAAFQVLIYVGAVMVFMVYAIMLLDPRDEAASTAKYSKFLWPGIIGFALLAEALAVGYWNDLPPAPRGAAGEAFGISRFSATFLSDYWLHFELTSVLLLAAVVAALAVIKENRRHDRG
ncbi:MAG TPA: NADH-quinone oxidoreductase subunit J [Usitatibacteraceae bacterium]|nr:NADH-quinone oxidoreductase subunit J [Usitatibacteraceae bacterium]